MCVCRQRPPPGVPVHPAQEHLQLLPQRQWQGGTRVGVQSEPPGEETHAEGQRQGRHGLFVRLSPAATTNTFRYSLRRIFEKQISLKLQTRPIKSETFFHNRKLTYIKIVFFA